MVYVYDLKEKTLRQEPSYESAEEYFEVNAKEFNYGYADTAQYMLRDIFGLIWIEYFDENTDDEIISYPFDVEVDGYFDDVVGSLGTLLADGFFDKETEPSRKALEEVYQYLVKNKM